MGYKTCPTEEEKNLAHIKYCKSVFTTLPVEAKPESIMHEIFPQIPFNITTTNPEAISSRCSTKRFV